MASTQSYGKPTSGAPTGNKQKQGGVPKGNVNMSNRKPRPSSMNKGVGPAK